MHQISWKNVLNKLHEAPPQRCEVVTHTHGRHYFPALPTGRRGIINCKSLNCICRRVTTVTNALGIILVQDSNALHNISVSNSII